MSQCYNGSIVSKGGFTLFIDIDIKIRSFHDKSIGMIAMKRKQK